MDAKLDVLLNSIFKMHGMYICNGKLESPFQKLSKLCNGWHVRTLANNGLCKCHIRKLGIWTYYAANKNLLTFFDSICNDIDAFQLSTVICQDGIFKCNWYDIKIIVNPCYKHSLEELCIMRDMQMV